MIRFTDQTGSGLSAHVEDDHRNSVRAAREAGVPDSLIMLAHNLGEGLRGCNDRPGNTDVNVTPSDNILSVAHFAGRNWAPADIARVLVSYRRAGNTGLVVHEVLTDLDRALSAPPQSHRPAVLWQDVITWMNAHDWIGEYCQYVEAGHYNFGDHMVKSRIPFRYGQHLIGAKFSADRWNDLVEIALLSEDGTPTEQAIDQFLPYLTDPRVKQESLITLYSWTRQRGVESAVLFGLAGLSKQEGLNYQGEPDTLHTMAALRA